MAIAQSFNLFSLYLYNDTHYLLLYTLLFSVITIMWTFEVLNSCSCVAVLGCYETIAVVISVMYSSVLM